MKKIILLLSVLLFFQLGNGIEAKKSDPSLYPSFKVEKLSETDPTFKDVQVTKIEGEYVVTGQTKAKKRAFYYTVEDGHHVFISERVIKLTNKKDTNWNPFELKFSISVDKLPDNGVLLLNLYEKNKSGDKMNHFPIVVDTFKGK